MSYLLTDAELRKKKKRLRDYFADSAKQFESWADNGYKYPPPPMIPFPEDCRDVICGARAKSTGHPCKRKDLYSNGRCKLHGGLSTGPKTINGKRKSAKNGFQSQKMQQL